MFNPLKNLLPQHIRKIGISRQVESALVLERFNKAAVDIFGEKILEKFKPLHLKDKVITVACLNSVVAQELKLNEAGIINVINQFFSREVATRLKFII